MNQPYKVYDKVLLLGLTALENANLTKTYQTALTHVNWTGNNLCGTLQNRHIFEQGTLKTFIESYPKITKSDYEEFSDFISRSSLLLKTDLENNMIFAFTIK